MQCPQCRSEQPLWAQFCMQCGAKLFSVPGLQPPADLQPRPATAPLPAPPQVPPPVAEVKDYRPHILLGLILAFVATLVVPPLLGGIAVYLGWLAYTKGHGAQRQQGLLVIAAGVVATAVGLVIGFAVETLKLLGQ